MKKEKVRLSGIERISRDSYLLYFPKPFAFRAGQVVGISMSAEGSRRLYSIASGEDEPLMRILFRHFPEGTLTPGLSDLKAGDTLYIDGPAGEFVDEGHPSWWIAAGTGLAPFYSMFRSGIRQNRKLIHGVSWPEYLYFREELAAAMGANYIPCVSRSEVSGTFNGRVTHWLEQQADLPAEHKYYLCGGTEMVIESRDILLKKGIPFKQIISEIYF
jgi:ferredoxin--NADP+ reductase